jgi:hypothetical protein
MERVAEKPLDTSMKDMDAAMYRGLLIGITIKAPRGGGE